MSDEHAAASFVPDRSREQAFQGEDARWAADEPHWSGRWWDDGGYVPNLRDLDEWLWVWNGELAQALKWESPEQGESKPVWDPRPMVPVSQPVKRTDNRRRIIDLAVDRRVLSGVYTPTLKLIEAIDQAIQEACLWPHHHGLEHDKSILRDVIGDCLDRTRWLGRDSIGWDHMQVVTLIVGTWDPRADSLAPARQYVLDCVKRVGASFEAIIRDAEDRQIIEETPRAAPLDQTMERIETTTSPAARDEPIPHWFIDAHRCLLQAALELDAVSEEKRRTRATITAQALNLENSGDAQAKLNELVRHNFFASKEGRGGGIWLTALGLRVSKELAGN